VNPEESVILLIKLTLRKVPNKTIIIRSSTPRFLTTLVSFTLLDVTNALAISSLVVDLVFNVHCIPEVVNSAEMCYI
jgi:hypothetical protein